MSDRDLTPATRSAPSMTVRQRLVRQVMTTPVRCIRPSDDLVAAAREMLAWRISALPVVDHGTVVGIVTATDCLRALVIRPAPAE